MNDNERRRYEMLVRVKQFGIDNAADFAPASVATTQFTKVDTEVGATESKGASQQAGFGEAGQQYEVKGTARENLREQMSDIARQVSLSAKGFSIAAKDISAFAKRISNAAV